MGRVWITFIAVLLASGATALERIKKKPPTATEAERIASDAAMTEVACRRAISSAYTAAFFSTAASGSMGLRTISCLSPIPS